MWTLEKLNQYIKDQIEESLYLDYKAADSLVSSEGKKTEISKDVSSFANSDGGIIIYGVKEFQSGSTYLPEKIDPVNRNSFSKETLEQILNTRISPKLHGVIITPITIGDLANNHVVYVVEIPKSSTAHQASDKRYYRRYNFQSIAMDDWEIKDIINRQNKSLIKIYFRPKFNSSFFEKYIKESGIPLKFDIIAWNQGHKVVEYCDCIIAGTEKTSKELIPKPRVENNYFELYYENIEEYKVSLKGDEFIVNTKRKAILPMTYRVIGQVEFQSDFFKNEQEITVTVTMDDNRISRRLKGREFVELD